MASPEYQLELALSQVRSAEEDANIDARIQAAMVQWLSRPDAPEGLQIQDVMRELAAIDESIPRYRGVEQWMGEYDACLAHVKSALARHGWCTTRTLGGVRTSKRVYVRMARQLRNTGAMRQPKVGAERRTSQSAENGHDTRLRANGDTLSHGAALLGTAM